MSASDLATFHQDLFEHRVFDKPATLAEMLRKGEHEGAEEYRLGISVKRVDGRECYSHAGFWGEPRCITRWTLAYRLRALPPTAHRDRHWSQFWRTW
jgi:hypothetical protein